MFETTKGYVSVKFEATYCQPCKQLGKILEKISDEFPEITFKKIDIDDENELAMRYKVCSVPTTILFKDGEIVGRFSGAPKIDAVRKVYRDFLAAEKAA